MKNYISESTKKMNLLTKILILAFFIIAGIYGLQKFFNYWNFQSPILLRSPLKRIYQYSQPIEKSQEDDKKSIISTPTPTIRPETKNINKESWYPNKWEAEDVAKYWASKYGVNEELFVCVLRNESGLSSRLGGSLKCGDNGQSCGIAQFKLSTFLSIRRNAGWTQEDLRGNDYEAIKTAAYGFANGWKYHWTPYQLCRSI